MDTRVLTPADWSSALSEIKGPQLIIAGPGTGKTEFLARRCAHLVAEGVSPSAIVALTFSRRAAQRLTNRIRSLVDGPAPTATTFHSLAHRLLETYAPPHFAWGTMPTLLTGPEQVALVRGLLSSEAADRWFPTFRPILSTQTFAREVADFLMRSQEYLIDDEDLRRHAAEIPEWRGLVSFRRRYSEHLTAQGRIDYGSLQAQALHLLEIHEVRRELDQHIEYVVVDEYQDTTRAQAQLIRYLGTRRNVTVAGDPDQSIYRFRGAEVGNILSFPTDFDERDDVRVFELGQSFRCPAPVLDAGRGLLASAQPASHELHRALEPAPHAGSVEAYVFSQASEEAEWIAREIQQLALTEEIPLSRIAVLMRSKRGLLKELSRALSRRGIDHNRPDSRLVDHAAVQLVFDLAFASTHDAVPSQTGVIDEVDRAMRRLLLGPLFQLTLGEERRALRQRHITEQPWSEVVRHVVPDGEALAQLLASPHWATQEPAAAGFWHVWSELPQFGRLVADPARADFRAALASFSQAIGRLYERDPGSTLLDYRALAESDDFEAEPLLTAAAGDVAHVTLTTLHQAKGLEFDVVFVADAAEGVFPDLRRNRSLLQHERLAMESTADTGTESLAQLREESRLAYTATTRASRRVVWTATSAGFDQGGERPSRFLDAVAGTRDHSAPPQETGGPPLTYLEAEATLRRVATDPAAPPPQRLAAVDQLARRPNPGVRPATAFTMVRPRGPDVGVVSPPIRLSPSQAEKYASCPRRYALERRLAVDADYGPYGTFGTMMHHVLEVAERLAIDQGRQRSDMADARRALDRVFDSFDFGSGERRTAWRKRGDALIAALYAAWIRPDARPVLLEHPLTLELEGIEWIGRADRIEEEDGLIRIVDYKTTTTPVGVAEAKQSLQLGFYLLAAQRDPAVCAHGSPVEAEMWFPLAKGGPARRAFDPGNLPEIEATLCQIAAAIADENWEPRPSPDCERCSVRLVCPAFPEGREAFVR